MMMNTDRKGLFSLLLGSVLAVVSPGSMVRGEVTDHWESLFYHYSTFTYFTSAEGEFPEGWRDNGFDDSAWRTGNGGIGYGDGDDGTVIEPCLSVALRKAFNIKDATVITEAVLHMDYDDAFVAYLNGMEIARSPGLVDLFPSYNQSSSVNHEALMHQGGYPEAFRVHPSLLSSFLQEGENVLTVQVHNTGLNSSDLTAAITFSVALSVDGQHYLNTPSWFEPPFGFTSSTLPIILIDTDGVTIPDEPKITARMKIIYNGEGMVNHPEDRPNEYDGLIGIEVRGASSASYPQRPWALETRDSLGENNNVPLLGMPSENDWVLLSHYNEKSFMRNMLSFHLFEEMGHYSIRSRLVQVVLNGRYEGIYLLAEKVKRDKNRIDISRITPQSESGDSLTGGYIFKTEYYGDFNTWLSDYAPVDHPSHKTHFAYYYPKYYEITDKQKIYLKSSVDQFQYALHQPDFADRYADYIDVPSFIDYFLVAELARNIDSYKKSRYYYKDRDSNGGLFHAGPVWDFDWAWKNIPSCLFQTTDCSGWAYRVNDCQNSPSPGWMVRLLQDPAFMERVQCRYLELRRTVLSDDSIEHFMDSIYQVVNDEQVIHFQRWQILGVPTGAPEIEPPAQTYDEEVQRLRNWIGKRVAWLDAKMPGSADNCLSESAAPITDDFIFRMFPNPATSLLYLEAGERIINLEVFDISGRLVGREDPGGAYSVQLNVSTFQPGIYFVKIKTETGRLYGEKLVINP
ncbi:MAG: CotH kinase family protein [Bacteroidota bacterium]